jgi:hypothetical protein
VLYHTTRLAGCNHSKQKKPNGTECKNATYTFLAMLRNFKVFIQVPETDAIVAQCNSEKQIASVNKTLSY